MDMANSIMGILRPPPLARAQLVPSEEADREQQKHLRQLKQVQAVVRDPPRSGEKAK